MPWTQSELDALKTAYASGTTRVTYEGRTVEYDTGAALLARIRNIEAEVLAAPGRPRHNSALTRFSRY
jgi:hypothetical protein